MTSEEDLNPRPCTVNDHPSVLAHEMMTIEPGEKRTLILTWKTTVFISHIQSRSHDDRFPIPLCFDHYGDHIQTCQCQSAALPAHEWIVYRLSLLLRSVGHRVKTHRITPVADNGRGDIEIQDYVILSRGEDDRIPPRTLVMDVTMTHDRYGHTTQHTNGALTHRVSFTGAPHPDGALNKSVRMKIRHYRQIYTDRPDPIVFLPSDQFRFFRVSRLTNLKGSVGLILAKTSAMRVTIPIDLSTWPFIPLPRFLTIPQQSD